MSDNGSHQHQWTEWDSYDGLSFLRIRRCRFPLCPAYEYGLFSNAGTFLRLATEQQVEQYMQEVETIHRRHNTERTIAETDYHSTLLTLHSDLDHALQAAKIRLLGGIH